MSECGCTGADSPNHQSRPRLTTPVSSKTHGSHSTPAILARLSRLSVITPCDPFSKRAAVGSAVHCGATSPRLPASSDEGATRPKEFVESATVAPPPVLAAERETPPGIPFEWLPQGKGGGGSAIWRRGAELATECGGRRARLGPTSCVAISNLLDSTNDQSQQNNFILKSSCISGHCIYWLETAKFL